MCMFCFFSRSVSHVLYIFYCFTCRFSLATVTTTCTKRTCSSPPSTLDSSASYRGRGMNALPCEWSCWAAMSRTPPSPALLFSDSLSVSPSPLLYFPPFLLPSTTPALPHSKQQRAPSPHDRHSWGTDVNVAGKKPSSNPV